eukprot:365303-Chlamydomonas_euryale.AAC.26
MVARYPAVVVICGGAGGRCPLFASTYSKASGCGYQLKLQGDRGAWGLREAPGQLRGRMLRATCKPLKLSKALTASSPTLPLVSLNAALACPCVHSYIAADRTPRIMTQRAQGTRAAAAHAPYGDSRLPPQQACHAANAVTKQRTRDSNYTPGPHLRQSHFRKAPMRAKGPARAPAALSASSQSAPHPTYALAISYAAPVPRGGSAVGHPSAAPLAAASPRARKPARRARAGGAATAPSRATASTGHPRCSVVALRGGVADSPYPSGVLAALRDSTAPTPAARCVIARPIKTRGSSLDGTARARAGSCRATVHRQPCSRATVSLEILTRAICSGAAGCRCRCCRCREGRRARAA